MPVTLVKDALNVVFLEEATENSKSIWKAISFGIWLMSISLL
jgi:hypothetical protein